MQHKEKGAKKIKKKRNQQPTNNDEQTQQSKSKNQGTVPKSDHANGSLKDKFMISVWV
jgi:hypothetical protein